METRPKTSRKSSLMSASVIKTKPPVTKKPKVENLKKTSSAKPKANKGTTKQKKMKIEDKMVTENSSPKEIKNEKIEVTEPKVENLENNSSPEKLEIKDEIIEEKIEIIEHKVENLENNSSPEEIKTEIIEEKIEITEPKVENLGNNSSPENLVIKEEIIEDKIEIIEHKVEYLENNSSAEEVNIKEKTVQQQNVEIKKEAKADSQSTSACGSSCSSAEEPPAKVYQFKFILKVRPPVWRQVQLLGSCNFHELHIAIQKSMGWKSAVFDCHLHKFEIKDPVTLKKRIVAEPSLSTVFEGAFLKSEFDITISEYFRAPGTVAEYEYDFGEGWDHEVRLEKILNRKPGETYPKCVGWKGICPPEDNVEYTEEEEEEEEEVEFDPERCFL